MKLQTSKQFTALYHSVMGDENLDLYEKVILSELIKGYQWFTEKQGEEFAPSMQKLSVYTGISRGLVEDIFFSLRDKGYISVKESVDSRGYDRYVVTV
ncbi:hypothetical protein CB599_11640 [Salmonella enterica subsp. enterica serovar Adjame]|nr:hypothetical protein [Salmonella enterica subsp. enterica serovar Adjame]